MINISYSSALIFVSVIWLICRVFIWVKNKKINIKRELSLLLVYICIIVVVRFTFFPFFKVNGKIGYLTLDISKIFPPRVNIIPFVNLFDYEKKSEAIINFIGNSTMFIPIGIILPSVYKSLNSHKKALFAGAFFSLVIEILQLPFFSRVTDIDDLILNFIGYLIGYLILTLTRKIRKRN